MLESADLSSGRKKALQHKHGALAPNLTLNREFVTMPGNRVITKKKLQSRKGAVNGSKLHPNSRRAKQLQRVELREKKLGVQGKVRRSTEIARIDRHIYFVHAIPEDKTSLSLPELHQVLIDYIARNDEEAAELKLEREGRAWRKTEGKSKREVELDVQKEADLSEYRSGFVLPDLTLAENVFLCRQWITPIPTSAAAKRALAGGDPSFLGRIRLIRISSEDRGLVVIEQDGARAGEWGKGEGEVEMDEGDEEESEGDQ